MGWRSAALLCGLLAACSDGTTPFAAVSEPSAPAGPPTATAQPAATARLVFVGDVMLGRGVAPVVNADPTSVFERLRPALVGADLAFANLESPLTARPHAIGPYPLEADPTAATLLAGAGLDVLGIANNHAGDAGPETVLDTIAAAEAAGLRTVGGGATADDAAAPLVMMAGGVRVGTLAYDLSGGTAATDGSAGVNVWATDDAQVDIAELRARVDVVVVGLHAGTEYLPKPDPALRQLVDLLAEWGADVVWAHGAHVQYPIVTVAGPTRPTVAATGLGNAVFDQRLVGTDEGRLLEVLVDADGVVAFRTGLVSIDAGRATFAGWDDPSGDAAALQGEWWSPVRPWTAATLPSPSPSASALVPDGYDVVETATGDVTGTGVADAVVAYRRPAIDHPVHDRFPDVDWVDPAGRSAHVAVYTPDGRMRWGSAFLFQPITELAVCDRAMAVAFSTLDDPAIIAGGVWTWAGFGFTTAPPLAGHATPTCADIDHDGRLDAVLADRGEH
jgi:poly-gamma-glutamate synthesis protein (capsule biosynthesis protein)